MAITFAADGLTTSALCSFVAGVGACAALETLARLRCGIPLRLRRAARPNRGCAFEVLTTDGGVLGWLPREDAEVLEAYGLDPSTLPARVSAIVPAFQRPRIRIDVLVPVSVEDVAPAA